MAHGVRGRRRKRLLSAAIALAVLFFSRTTGAQSIGERYDALVAQYARGDQENAVLAFTRWSRAETSAAIARADTSGGGPSRASVMLHTDTGIALLIAGATNHAVVHWNGAARQVSTMRNHRPDERAQRFASRWLAVIATVYTAHGMFGYAERTIRNALTWYSKEPLLYVARGALEEMRIGLTFVDQRSGYQITRRDRAYESAAADYRRAIKFDDRLAIAYLRLGWVHFTLHDDRARENFDAALARAADVRDRYLAHLFLAAAAERDNRLDEAQRDYEAAREAAPACQTPYIALTRLEGALGRTARAREIAASLTALPEKSNDPWWDFHLGGFDQVTLTWLRAEAARE